MFPWSEFNVISELEKTVDDAEKRCENLVQELKFYKKCCKKYYDVDVSSEAGRKTSRKVCVRPDTYLGQKRHRRNRKVCKLYC